MEERINREWSNSVWAEIRERQFEETAGRRRFYLILENNSFYEYEKRMLRESNCPYTLPMNFINAEEKLNVYYDFTEFIMLSEYINRKVSDNISERKNQVLLSDSLEVLMNLLNSLKGMENHLLFPDRMSIEIDTVFIHSENSRVVFSYIPRIRQQHSLQDRVIRIIEEIKCLYNQQEINQYYEKFIHIIKNKNLGLEGMINILGELQREISLIYWESKDFRTVEEGGLHHGENTIEVLSEKELLNRTQILKEVKIPFKSLMLQLALILSLAAVYFSGILEAESFIGLIVLAAGLDLWIMRKNAVFTRKII